MKFFPVETEYIYIGQPYLCNNNIYFASHCNSNAVVQFGDWGQELNVDSDTKTIISFEAIFSKKEIKKTDLIVPKFKDAKIIFDFVTDMKPMKIYYDECNKWFCFGNKNFLGKGYRFATDTIAVIYNDELEAIFIKPELIVQQNTK